MIEKISGIISKKIYDYDGTIDDYDLHGWVAIVAAEAAQEIDALYQSRIAELESTLKVESDLADERGKVIEEFKKHLRNMKHEIGRGSYSSVFLIDWIDLALKGNELTNPVEAQEGSE